MPLPYSDLVMEHFRNPRNVGRIEAADAKAKSYSIAYTHALSKRTTAYAGYMGTDNDDGLDISLVDAGYKSVGGIGQYETGEKSNLVAVGLRHTF